MTFQPTPETRLTLDLIAELIVRTPVFAGEESVGEVFDRLRACEGDFFGILAAGRYVGLVSKAQIGMLLSMNVSPDAASRTVSAVVDNI